MSKISLINFIICIVLCGLIGDAYPSDYMIANSSKYISGSYHEKERLGNYYNKSTIKDYRNVQKLFFNCLLKPIVRVENTEQRFKNKYYLHNIFSCNQQKQVRNHLILIDVGARYSIIRKGNIDIKPKNLTLKTELIL
jgi:hypothetical protein